MKFRILNILMISQLFLAFQLNNIQAQAAPVQWAFDVKKTANDTYEVTATAMMNPSWVIYSQFTDDEGPIPTEFTIDGKVVKFEEKSKLIKVFDELFGVNVSKFKETAVFKYTADKVAFNKSATVTYMTCDGSRCLPPTSVEFDIKLK